MIPAEDVLWAKAERDRTQRRIVDLIEEKLSLPREEFMLRLSTSLRIETIDMEIMRELQPDFSVVPFGEASRRSCLALRSPAGTLLLVVGDPYDSSTQDWIEETVRAPFSYRLAHPLDVSAYLSIQEEGLRAIDGLSTEQEGRIKHRGSVEDLSIESIGETESPVVRLINSTLYDALKAGASDIHLETSGSGLTVKYRIDGVLCTIKSVEGPDFADQAISRVKVKADLDISERRVPQDGRFKVSAKGREIDLRVSIMPSVFGEDAVLRILDKQSLSDHLHGLSLDQLGFDAGIMQRVRRLSAEPHGMLLVTGPTGSGKTTTLYAVMSEINKGLDKIVTIEDPVEYQLPGVLQIPVNEKKGLTFARGLRSILRHDPDRIMVGEIRDPETAEIAVQSALTGHLVYTTVHANSVFDVIGRFMHMGVDTFNFVSALNAVMAQRLVRVNCPQCRAADIPSATLLEESAIPKGDVPTFTFLRGRGCSHCRGTGFKGRKAIAELMVMNDELRELISARAPVRQLKQAARASGTRSLREAALDLVRSGETTLDEINRVTFVAG